MCTLKLVIAYQCKLYTLDMHVPSVSQKQMLVVTSASLPSDFALVAANRICILWNLFSVEAELNAAMI